MTIDLEERLRRAGETLPTPSDQVSERARERALRALPRRRARPQRLGLLTVGAAAAVAGVVLVLAAPWQGRSPLATERALAALGDRPVIHAVVENERPHTTIVDLQSGAERPEVTRDEYWYDEQRSLLRTRLTIDGHLVTEFLQTREGAVSDLGPVRGNAGEPRLDPALAGFASGYREALESGEARVAGETTIDGRDAILLEIDVSSPPYSPVQIVPYQKEVAIDAESYRPLRFRYREGGTTSDWWRVVVIETLEREEGQFAPPTPRPEPHTLRQTQTAERSVTPGVAATALDRPAVWAGEAVGGIAVAKIEVMKVTTEWSDGRETETRALRVEYGERPRGRPGGHWLVLTVGTSKELGRFGSYPGLEPGALRLVRLGDGDGGDPDMWFGTLDLDGLYLGFEAPQRDLILAAARALRPIR